MMLHYRHLKNLLRKDFDKLSFAERYYLLDGIEPAGLRVLLEKHLVLAIYAPDCGHMPLPWSLNCSIPVMWLYFHCYSVEYYVGIDILRFLDDYNRNNYHCFDDVYITVRFLTLRDFYACAADYFGYDLKRRLGNRKLPIDIMRKFYKRDVKTTLDAEVLFAKVFARYMELLTKEARENGRKGGLASVKSRQSIKKIKKSSL